MLEKGGTGRILRAAVAPCTEKLRVLHAGVAHVEVDAIRRIMTRTLRADEVVAAASSSVQPAAAPMQPYGLDTVQANLFPTASRSTTSPVNPAKKFPICIIGEAVPCSVCLAVYMPQPVCAAG